LTWHSSAVCAHTSAKAGWTFTGLNGTVAQQRELVTRFRQVHCASFPARRTNDTDAHRNPIRSEYDTP
jgi:hypothetical protein